MPAAVSEELKTRSHNFAVVLYPQEDANHKRFIEYVSNHDRLFKCVWIEHDSDLMDDGSPKKHHVHMLVYHKKQWSVSAFLKFFAGWIDYAEPVYSAESYIAYMCHDTPDSANKHYYDPSLLRGDKRLIANVFSQNPYFVQLGEFAERCREGANISDIIIDTVSINDKSQRDIAYETFTKFSHVICCMSNQEKNDIKERNRINADAINYNDFDTFEEYPQIKVFYEV